MASIHPKTRNVMRYEKGNEYEWKTSRPLDKDPLCIRLDEGLKAKVRKIPGWQDKVRDLLKDWVDEQEF